jgi:hypothetical protein
MGNPGARILRVDALLELIFAVLCLITAAVVPVTALPTWFGPPILIVLAVILLAAGGLLLWLARTPTASVLRGVGIGNTATALVIILLALLAPSPTLGLRLVLVVCAVIIGGLGALQLRLAARG